MTRRAKPATGGAHSRLWPLILMNGRRTLIERYRRGTAIFSGSDLLFVVAAGSGRLSRNMRRWSARNLRAAKSARSSSCG